MYEILKSSHSHLALLALGVIILSAVLSLVAWLSNKNYGSPHKPLALVAMIAAHIQLLIGLVLYFVSPYGFSNFSGANMKDSFSRLLMLEHPITNILAIIVITIGHSKAKKAFGTVQGNKNIAVYYLIGLVLLLSRIPWGQWPKF
jgi:cytochrome bd-type quinol oxidase subunit 2